MKTVVGVLLNFRGAWDAMLPVMQLAPHFKPPLHPVLYLKPANTWRGDGDDIWLPDGSVEVEVGATLGVVLGAAAARVREDQALRYVAGYRVVNDVTLPHTTILRPPLAQKCRDSFCPMGPMRAADLVADLGALQIRVSVGGLQRASNTTANLLRSVPRLLAEITEFMSLDAGDMLLVGVPEGMPRARAGDRVVIEIDGVGRLENTIRSRALS